MNLNRTSVMYQAKLHAALPTEARASLDRFITLLPPVVAFAKPSAINELDAACLR
jgi:hypothetical protein